MQEHDTPDFRPYHVRYGFGEMKVGEKLVVNNAPPRLSDNVHSYGKSAGKKFNTRTERGSGITAIWRTA